MIGAGVAFCFSLPLDLHIITLARFSAWNSGPIYFTVRISHPCSRRIGPLIIITMGGPARDFRRHSGFARDVPLCSIFVPA